MKMGHFGTVALLVASIAATAAPVPEGAQVYIITPDDGAVISGPVTVRFGLRGMGVAPAGIDRAGTGHHHLLIDVDALPPLDQPLPATERILHFGGGQTEVTLRLAPGAHTLRLVLGDYAHKPHEPPVVSDLIHITVAEEH